MNLILIRYYENIILNDQFISNLFKQKKLYQIYSNKNSYIKFKLVKFIKFLNFFLYTKKLDRFRGDGSKGKKSH